MVWEDGLVFIVLNNNFQQCGATYVLQQAYTVFQESRILSKLLSMALGNKV
jgi:hypothetical protein